MNKTKKEATLNCCYGFNYEIKLQRESTTMQVLSSNSEKFAIIEIVTRDIVIQNDDIPARGSLLYVRIRKTSSVVVVQKHFRTKFFKEATQRYNIRRWMKQFQLTDCLC